MSNYLYKGVDVSGVQGNIDWAKAKANGVDFAILKATGGNTITDSRFHANMKAAQAAGVPVGAYHFFYASNVAETKAEAQYFLDTIKGYTFQYPLVLDVERNALNLPKETLVSLVELFCDMVEEAGYYVSIYASASPLNGVLNDERLKRFDMWVAQWSDKEPSIPYPYGMWQYSNQGSVPGIPARVDLDYAYKDYPAIMKQAGLNGYGKAQAPEESPKVGQQVTLNRVPLYGAATAKATAGTVTGTYYLYDGKEISGRYRITNSPARVGKEPIGANVTGWVDKKYL